MAYLLTLTVILILLIILFSRIRTIRDERKEILWVFASVSFVVIVAKFLVPVFDSNINLLFISTSSLCLVSLGSLYLRNVILETRTSGYLFLLAIFPFLLFYVFLFLYNIYAYRMNDGLVFEYLEFFHLKTRSILFAITICYDVYLLYPWRKQIAKLGESIDGQLALVLFLVKIVCLILIVVQGITLNSDFLLVFPDSLYTILSLSILLYFRFSQPTQLYFAYLFKSNALMRYEKSNHKYQGSSELILIVSAMDQLIDQEKLFKNPNLKLGDLRRFLPISEKNLKLIHKYYFNNNFESYLNGKRITYFLERLAHIHNEPTLVNKLLVESGFKDNSEFNKIFKKEMGCSIRTYTSHKSLVFYP